MENKLNKMYELGYEIFDWDREGNCAIIKRPSGIFNFVFDFKNREFIKERNVCYYNGISMKELEAVESQFREFNLDVPESNLTLEKLLETKKYKLEKHKSKDIYYIWCGPNCTIQFHNETKIFLKNCLNDDPDKIRVLPISLDDIEIIKKMMNYLGW